MTYHLTFSFRTFWRYSLLKKTFLLKINIQGGWKLACTPLTFLPKIRKDCNIYKNNWKDIVKDSLRDWEEDKMLNFRLWNFSNFNKLYCQVLERNWLNTRISYMGWWGGKILSKSDTIFSLLISGTGHTERP